MKTIPARAQVFRQVSGKFRARVWTHSNESVETWDNDKPEDAVRKAEAMAAKLGWVIDGTDRKEF